MLSAEFETAIPANKRLQTYALEPHGHRDPAREILAYV